MGAAVVTSVVCSGNLFPSLVSRVFHCSFFWRIEVAVVRIVQMNHIFFLFPFMRSLGGMGDYGT